LFIVMNVVEAKQGRVEDFERAPSSSGSGF
jgi:hypothetical protein